MMNCIKKGLIIALAEIPPFLLFLPKNKIGIMAEVCFFILFGIILYRKMNTGSVKISFDIIPWVILASVSAGIAFYIRWQNTGRIKTIAAMLNFPAKQFCAVCALLLSLGFSFSLCLFLRVLMSEFSSEKRTIHWNVLYIFLLAAVSITLLSKSSPFYPFNDWVDPNTMFSVGKGMLKGLVPYRDLYEQKGPLLLALHALEAVISFDTLKGIWIIEIAACFFTLLFLYKILFPWTGRKTLITLPILAAVIYVSRAFVAGDSAEEMSLPLLTYGLYAGINAIRGSRLPSKRESFLVGLTSGCVLWIKFSHLGFYAGWFLFFLVTAFQKKQVRQLIQMLIFIICGVITASLPVFLYFGINRSIRVFLECYFLNNIRYYPAFGAASGPFRHLINLWRGFLRFTEANPALLVFTFAGLLWCYLHNEKRVGSFLLLCMAAGFLVMFISGVSFPYYVFIYGSFSAAGVLWINDIHPGGRPGLSTAGIISFYFCMLCCLLFSSNIYLLAYNREDFPQFRVKEIIENSGIEDPTILHYGLLDAGFNLPSGLVPKQRFWCSFNLLLPEMETAQNQYIEQAETDFVITCHEPLYNTKNYQLIGTFPGDFSIEGNSSLFFLYRKSETSGT